MKLANFERDGIIKAGIVKGDRIVDIAAAAGKAGIPQLQTVGSVDQVLEDSLLEIIRTNEASISAAEEGTPLGSVKLRSPVQRPEKILMVAVNYGAHGKETGTAPPTYPYFFTKFRNALIGPEEPIIAPKASKKVDWEVELAVVIGKEGEDISRETAYEYVAGYTISNDVSFRDFQSMKIDPLGLNWFKGKGMDASLPLGPWLVTRDEIPDPPDVALSLTVNGQQRQNARSSEMLIKIDELIAYASIGTTLRPGDIISTGTPDGIAAATGGPFLKDGDIVEATIEKIGTLRNPVKAQR